MKEAKYFEEIVKKIKNCYMIDYKLKEDFYARLFKRTM